MPQFGRIELADSQLNSQGLPTKKVEDTAPAIEEREWPGLGMKMEMTGRSRRHSKTTKVDGDANSIIDAAQDDDGGAGCGLASTMINDYVA